MPRANGNFEVLEKVNNNVYEINLPETMEFHSRSMW